MSPLKLPPGFENYPALAPPPGTKSNFINPNTLRRPLVVLNIVFLSLMFIIVIIRLYARGVILHSLGIDDVTCIISALGSIGHTALMLYDTSVGYGTHLWDIRISTFEPQTGKLISALAIVYPIVIFFVKLTISLLYLRIFKVHDTFRKLVWAGVWVNFIFYTAIVGYQIANLTLCNSIENLSTRICATTTIVAIGVGCFNVITDLYILCLPIPILVKLQVKFQKKIGLLLIFGAGFIACTVSIVRVVYMGKQLHNPDILYNAAFTSMFTIVEMNIGIIAASMTSLPVALKKGKSLVDESFNSLHLNELLRSVKTSLGPSKVSLESKWRVPSQKPSQEEIPLQGRASL